MMAIRLIASSFSPRFVVLLVRALSHGKDSGSPLPLLRDSVRDENGDRW